MKKVLTFLVAVGFLSTSSLNVIACGVGNGLTVPISDEEPQKAKDGQDPLNPQAYIYNDTYSFFDSHVAIGQAAQLTVDKIKNDNQTNYNSDIWKDFYKSNGWTDGFFAGFGLDTSRKPADEHDFSFTVANNDQLYYAVQDNDASKDVNKLRLYWFITSSLPWSETSPDTFLPTKDNITIPNLSEFSDTVKKITREGWIHEYLLIDKYRIDFSAKIIFSFSKLTDKNNLSIVGLNEDTWKKPFGIIINADDPSPVYNSNIANVSIKEV